MENKNNNMGGGLMNIIGGQGSKPLASSASAPADSTYQEVSVDLIDPCSDQPRKVFNQEDLLSLSASIKESGIIQPLIVVRKEDGRFELIAGERRLRASKLAGLEKVPVVIKNTNDQAKAVMALIENLQRKDLSPLEIAQAYQQLQDEYSISKEELSKKIGVSRSIISNYIRMLTMPEEIKKLLEEEKISFGHCKVLAGVKPESRAIELALKCAAQQLPVAKLEKLWKAEQENKATAKDSPKKEDTSQDNFGQEVASKMKEKLQLSIDNHEHKENEGKIVIHYKTKEDLDKILSLIKE